MEPTATTANIRNITLVEDISSIHVTDPIIEGVRDWSDISSIHASDVGVALHRDSTLTERAGAKAIDYFDRPALDDGFGGELGVGIIDEDVDDVFNIQMTTEQQQQQAEQQQEVPEHQPRSVQRPESAMSDRSDSMSYGAPASMAPSGPPSTPGSVPPPPPPEEEEDMFAPPPVQDMEDSIHPFRKDLDGKRLTETQDTMVLEPLESQGIERKRKRRKKLGMLIDEVKTLSGEEMKAQLSDTTDIVTTLDLAPPSKKLMHWKKTGTSEKMFALPERQMPSKLLLVYYTRHLTTTHIDRAEEELLPELMNGDLSRLERTLPPAPPLPELEDLEEQLPILSPIPDLQPPKTPRTPGHTRTPPKKKRKTEDKEKKPRQPRDITNHVRDEPVIDRDLSSIQDVRAGSLQTSEPFPQLQPLDDFEEEDDDYGAPMSVGPVGHPFSFIEILLIFNLF